LVASGSLPAGMNLAAGGTMGSGHTPGTADRVQPTCG
jgi:hypothetical protein